MCAPRNDKSGFILILTFILMLTLVLLGGALLYMVTYETRDMGAQIQDCELLNLAEAGVQRAMREIRDDVLTITQTGIADLRGEDTSGSVSVGSINNIRYLEDPNATINDNSDIALLRAFDANYVNTGIISVLLGVRADRGGGGTGATIEVSYTTNGAFPEAGNTVLTQALTTTPTDYLVDITADRAWTWATIMSPNFILRAARTAGNRRITLDFLYLRVTYEIDTNTEPWAAGSYAAFPISLGSGTIPSISIIAEQGKVHLNTASQALLRYLMAEHGVADATANTVATSIVNYRATNNFDSIEEIQQVSGMTLSIYDAIKPDITVYSFINAYAQGPLGARAPININTASREVLEAMFDPLTFNNPSDITNLADAIISQRNTTPFTCFYASDTSVISDFYDFERSQSYLSNTEDDRVLGNADASLLEPRSGGDSEDALTAEFCYDTNAFKVESLAEVSGRRFRVKIILGDDGAHAFTNYSADTSAVGWRRENFE